jgi:small-conductance mechanosensitive channel
MVVLALSVTASAQQQPAPKSESNGATSPAGQPTQPAQATPETQQPPADAKEPVPTGVPSRAAERIKTLSGAIDAARQSADRLRDSDADLSRIRTEVDQITTELASITERLRPLLAAARKQVESLGPLPAKDAPPEAPTVAAERERLNAILANIDGALKTIDLSEVRARELVQRITDLRQSLFTRSLFERNQSPLLPYHWQRGARDLPATVSFGSYVAADWFTAAGEVLPAIALTLIAALTAWVGLGLVARWIERATDSPPPDGRTFVQRAQRVAWLAPLRTMPAVAALAILYAGLLVLGLLNGPGGTVIRAVIAVLVLSVVVGTLIRSVLSPYDPGLRLVDLTDRAASHISWYLIGIVVVYATDLALAEIGRALVAPLSIVVMRTFLASLMYAGLLVGLLLTPFTAQPIQSPETGAIIVPVTSRMSPWWLKLPLWALTLLILLTTLLGYLALGRFIAQQLVLTGTVFVAAGLVYLTIRSVTRTIEEPTNPIGHTLSTNLRFGQARLNEFAWLAEALLTIALLLVAVPLVLVQWGFTAADIRDWFTSAFFGFEIGQFRISPARILLGIVLFIGLLFGTRILQRWLRERILQPRRLEAGISHSIETAVGYAGIALSAIIAVSYAGLDITNLAIVAGALSVGIGFGLQSIVNNFVSGLILLVERPVKVGDWIVVGDQQGNVRRISVRSTEIETFERSRLIIPNSELITGRVLNKTHRSLLGRGSITIGVHYNADPDKVVEILMACAKAHPLVLSEPAPGASLNAFGASTLDFFLWFFVADVSKSASVQSDVRIAILKAFKAAGIEIPYNQHDIHLRDLDGVRAILNRLAEERAAKAAPQRSAEPDKSSAQDIEEAPEPRERKPTPSGNGEDLPPGSPPARGG